MRPGCRGIGKGLPFFLPSALIELEYLHGDGAEDSKYAEMAKPYQHDIDFAFFAANFGYSKAEYESLTPREINFLYKAWENRVVSESYRIYNAVFTAMYNVNRPKRKKALALWKKSGAHKADMETIRENLSIIKEIDRAEGSEWARRVYRENGLKYPRKEEKHA